jgi:hypothetical protein
MLGRTKKLFIAFFLSVFLLTTFSIPFADAQTWYDQDFMGPNGFYAKVNDTDNPTEIFGERYTTAQVQWVVYGFGAFLINRIVPHGREIFLCANNDGDSDADEIIDCLLALVAVLGEASPDAQQARFADASKDWTMVFTNNHGLYQ